MARPDVRSPIAESGRSSHDSHADEPHRTRDAGTKGDAITMSDELTNKLLVNAGTFLATNGIILLVAPRRFSALRTSAWTPRAFDRALVRLGDSRLARAVGVFAASAGIAMAAYGIVRTRPNS